MTYCCWLMCLKHLLVLMISWRCLQDISWRRPQHNNFSFSKTSWRGFAKTSWRYLARHLEYVFLGRQKLLMLKKPSRCLEDLLKAFFKTFWRHVLNNLEDMSWRRLSDKENVYWGYWLLGKTSWLQESLEHIYVYIYNFFCLFVFGFFCFVFLFCCCFCFLFVYFFSCYFCLLSIIIIHYCRC